MMKQSANLAITTTDYNIELQLVECPQYKEQLIHEESQGEFSFQFCVSLLNMEPKKPLAHETVSRFHYIPEVEAATEELLFLYGNHFTFWRANHHHNINNHNDNNTPTVILDISNLQKAYNLPKKELKFVTAQHLSTNSIKNNENFDSDSESDAVANQYIAIAQYKFDGYLQFILPYQIIILFISIFLSVIVNRATNKHHQI